MKKLLFITFLMTIIGTSSFAQYHHHHWHHYYGHPHYWHHDHYWHHRHYHHDDGGVIIKARL